MASRIRQMAFMLALLPACVNLSSFETAEVLPRGEGRHHLGLSYYSGTTITDTLKENERNTWPNLEWGYRQGFGDDWEWNVRLTLVGSVAGGVKRTLYKDKKFAMALGLGVGYTYYRAENADDVNLVDYRLPVFTSYRLTPQLTVYAIPQYVWRSLASFEDHSISPWLGLTLGVIIQQRAALEAAWLHSIEGPDTVQFGVAWFLRNDRNPRGAQ